MNKRKEIMFVSIDSRILAAVHSPRNLADCVYSGRNDFRAANNLQSLAIRTNFLTFYDTKKGYFLVTLKHPNHPLSLCAFRYMYTPELLSFKRSTRGCIRTQYSSLVFLWFIFPISGFICLRILSIIVFHCPLPSV